MSKFYAEWEYLDRLYDFLWTYEGEIENTINDVLWGQGAQMINDSIKELLPVSGRSWKGKAKAAKSAAPFTQKNENLAVTVHTKYDYHYLYFPDDGSTTRKHAGNQQFMFRGAEKEQDRIIDLCIEKLIQKLEG